MLHRLLFPLALLLVLAGCATQAAAPTATPLPTPFPALTPTPDTGPTATPHPADTLTQGTRIDIGVRSLFLQCSGSGSPTVLLEAGLGADHSSWNLVQPAAAELTRVCSYDRAGLGQSDPAEPGRGGNAVVDDLVTLLQVAKIPGPYILVAHSFGALYAPIFVERMNNQVAGVVLVDPVHPDWWTRALAEMPPPSDSDSDRLRNFRNFLSTEVGDPERNAEQVDIPAVAADSRQAGVPGNVPLIILSARNFDVLAPGLPPEVEERLRVLFQQELPQDLASQSSDSTIVIVPDSGHNIPQQRPDMVVLAIRAVLAAIK